MFKKVIYFFVALLIVGISACGPDDPSDDDSCQNNFNQTSLFSHLVDHTLIPGYQDLFNGINDLKVTQEQFFLTPNQNTLEQFRVNYIEAYTTWQKVAQFEFGPAKEVFLRNSLNNFPANEQAIVNNIETGSYDFSMPDRYDKGFPALDFLLFGIANSDAEIIRKLNSNSDSDLYQNYIVDLIVDMQERVRRTNDGWNGSYKEKFKNNIGTAAGTSLSLIINGFNENYELAKREKLGVPSGVLTLNIPNPDRAEAYHSGLSTTLLLASIQASIDLFNGKGFDNSAGPGLVDVLDGADARKDNALLSDLVADQFEVLLTELDKLSEPLDTEIEANIDQIIAVYREMSKPLVNIKTDMPSVLCISITYIDNPSDSD